MPQTIANIDLQNVLNAPIFYFDLNQAGPAFCMLAARRIVLDVCADHPGEVSIARKAQ